MDSPENEAELSSFSRILLIVAVVAFASVGLLFIVKVVNLSTQLLSLLRKKAPPPPQEAKVEPTLNIQKKQLDSRQPDLKTLIKQSKAAKAKKASVKEDSSAHHELFVATLKGHSDAVNGVGWSSDGLSIVSACSDMQVRMFDLSSLASGKNPPFKYFRTRRTPLDAGYGDSTSEAVVLLQDIPNEAAVEMFRYVAPSGDASKPSGWTQAWQVLKLHGKEAPLPGGLITVAGTRGVVGDAGSGPRIGMAVSLSQKKDVRILDFQGRLVGMAEPNSLSNYQLAVSQNGRFLAVASFTADVKIWELQHTRDGFKGVQKVMDLKGHSGQVMAVALSPDGRRAATASKDGTLRVWNLEVRYHMNEDPKVLVKVPLPLPSGKCYQLLSYSGQQGVVAASHGGQVDFLDAASGQLLERVDAHEDAVTCVRWSPAPIQVAAGGGAGSVYVLATASKDHKVRLWRSPSLPGS